MTNPDNIVRVRARNGGRASVYEANGWAQAYSAGLLEGNGVKQNTSANMNVLVGGSTTKPDVVLAENAAGYRVALDIVGQQAVAITKPSSNSRISAIVAYTDDLSLGTTQDTVTGSPSTCGLIVVNGTAASTPSAPTDTQIRNAITSDGATGSQAAYCVIATILVASNTTAITDTLITTNVAKLAGTGVVTSQNIDFATLSGNYSKTEIDTGFTWIDGKTIYKKTVELVTSSSDLGISVNVDNIGVLIRLESIIISSTNRQYLNSKIGNDNSWDNAKTYRINCGQFNKDSGELKYDFGSAYSGSKTIYATIWYTKSS